MSRDAALDESVRALFASTADDVDACASHTAVMAVAVRCRRADIVQLLLADGRAAPTPSVLRDAGATGDVLTLQALLADSRVDAAARNSAVLWTAAVRGHVEAVGMLLADGRPDPAADRSEVLCAAATRGHTRVLEALLADGRANPAAQESRALRLAAARGHSKVVRLFLADGRSDPAADNSRALFNAAFGRHMAVVEILLADGRASPRAACALLGATAPARLLRPAARWWRRRTWLRACTTPGVCPRDGSPRPAV
jgi:hypothetical protein